MSYLTFVIGRIGRAQLARQSLLESEIGMTTSKRFETLRAFAIGFACVVLMMPACGAPTSRGDGTGLSGDGGSDGEGGSGGDSGSSAKGGSGGSSAKGGSGGGSAKGGSGGTASGGSGGTASGGSGGSAMGGAGGSTCTNMTYTLKEIGVTAASCNFDLPDVPFIREMVAVKLDAAFVAFSSTDGWQFTNSYTSIVVVGTWCNMITAGTNKTLTVSLKCPP